MSNSEEEEIARDYICFGNPDATIVVVDSTCLERNLNLVFQIMEITSNVIVCVNLLDEARKKKIKINLDNLSSILGVPVVGTIARDKNTLNSLIDTVLNVCKNNIKPSPKKIQYSPIIEQSISDLERVLKKECKVENDSNYNSDITRNLYRWISLKIIDGEETIINSIEKNLNINIQENESIKTKRKDVLSNLNNQGITSSNFKDEIVSSIVKESKKICTKVCTYEDKNYSR